MTPLINENLILLSGAPGTGKTTLIQALRQEGLSCINEPARQILAEQRLIGGQGTGDQDPVLFVELLLSRSLSHFRYAASLGETTLMDRGLPDVIAYARCYDLPDTHIRQAAELYRAQPRVFFCPPWEEIYETDGERQMSFEAVDEFDAWLRNAYLSLGYEILDLPKTKIGERLGIVREAIKTA